jgi:hypothetical protein
VSSKCIYKFRRIDLVILSLQIHEADIFLYWCWSSFELINVLSIPEYKFSMCSVMSISSCFVVVSLFVLVILGLNLGHHACKEVTLTASVTAPHTSFWCYLKTYFIFTTQSFIIFIREDNWFWPIQFFCEPMVWTQDFTLATSTLLLKPHLKFIFPCLFWRLCLARLAWNGDSPHLSLPSS